MGLPNFIIIGPGKTATTWLLRCLRKHPQIYMYPKEIRYFSFHYDKGEQWYRNHFPSQSNFIAIGEKSPSYFSLAPPERIYSLIPDAKLITILRNPVERAYSHYCMHLKTQKVSEEIDREIVPGTRYVDEGYYFNYLQNYLKYFERDGMKIMLFEDLARDPEEFLLEIYHFLDVEPSFKPVMADRKYHYRGSRPKHQNLYDIITKAIGWISQSGVGHELIEYLQTTRVRGFLWSLVKSDDGFPEMSPEKQDQLKTLYKYDVMNLSSLLDRDLNHWIS